MRRNKEGVTDLPDYIKQNIAHTVKRLSKVKGQPSLQERIRKALLYQEWAKGQPKPGVYRGKIV